MPRALPVLTVAALAVALVGCASAEAPAPEPQQSDDPIAQSCAAPGASSDAVRVSGELGEVPDVEFDAPLAIEGSERSIVIDGAGDEVASGAIASLQYSAYNGTTGESLGTTSYVAGDEILYLVGGAQTLDALEDAVACSTVGSRVVGVSPAPDGFSDIAAGEAIIFVVDVLDSITRATGVQQDPAADMPTVELAADGTPEITIPADFETPSESRSAVLIQGDGRVVEAGDNVYLHYRGVDAETGETFDQSWGRAPLANSASGFIPGFTNALVGQQVGSQFIVVIPPAEGYGEAGGGNTHDLAGKTLVFVVDVLAAVAPAG